MSRVYLCVVSPCPSRERQDSVYNALQKVDVDASLVCIHDAARPLVTKDSVYKVRRQHQWCSHAFYICFAPACAFAFAVAFAFVSHELCA